MLLAIVFALSSALVVAWGTVVRHRIAAQATRSTVLRSALSQPLWWWGTGAAVVAYGLQLLALAWGSLLIVQPILVLSLVFTLPLAAHYAHHRLASHEILWSTAVAGAVAVVVLYGRPLPGDAAPTAAGYLGAGATGAVLIGALIALSWWLPRQAALMLGLSCGVLYGYVALLSRAVVMAWQESGNAVVLRWEMWALIIAAAAGTIAQQYTFQAGSLNQSLPAMTIAEPLVAFGLGYAVLGEHFQISSLAGWMALAGAIAVMLCGVVFLARAPLGGTTAMSLSSPPTADADPLMRRAINVPSC